MKALSIGRDMSCDIVLHDNTDVISRRHAILNITSSGKMTIVDQSRNGTYVNGIKISANVPVPVTRKDVISFAHVSQLDWNLVPRSNSIAVYGAIALGVVLIVLACVFIPSLMPSGKEKTDVAPVEDKIESTTDKENSKAIEEVENKEETKSEDKKEVSGDETQKEKQESQKKSSAKKEKKAEDESSKQDEAEKKDSSEKKIRPVGI